MGDVGRVVCSAVRKVQKESQVDRCGYERHLQVGGYVEQCSFCSRWESTSRTVQLQLVLCLRLSSVRMYCMRRGCLT